jgi:acid phosphatase
MNIKRRDFLLLSSLTGLGLLLNSKTSFGDTQKNQPNTPLNEAKPLLSFVSVGDTGTGGQGQYKVAKAMNQYYQKNPFPFVILAGDNIYNYGEIEKINQVFELPYQELLQKGVKFYACLGNHDVRTNQGNDQICYPKFNMNCHRYYTFRQDSIQYFALDTNTIENSNTQLTWLDTELSRSNATWKIVFGHHPLYSSGAHGSSKNLISMLTPLFKKYGVQLYINGHDHNYERTRNLDGTTYLTCGGGAGLRPVGRSEWTEYSVSRLSFAGIDVYVDHILIKGIGTDGNVFDQGIISLQL